MANREKFLALVSKEKNDSLDRNRERIKNRAMLRESQKIALKIVLKLDELGWKQTDLAREMGVTPQQITKIVSGKENLSIETQIKLQSILNVPILASYYEDKMKLAESIQVMVAGKVVNYECVVSSTCIISQLESNNLHVNYATYNDIKVA